MPTCWGWTDILLIFSISAWKIKLLQLCKPSLQVFQHFLQPFIFELNMIIFHSVHPKGPVILYEDHCATNISWLIIELHQSSWLHLNTGRVRCGNIPSGCATNLYLWLCIGHEIISQPTHVSLKFIPKTGFTCTTHLRVT